MTIESLDDLEPGPAGVQRRWVDELQIAGKWQEKWETRSDQIIKRYEGEVGSGASSSFNILHSNTETIRPVLFSQTPNPDIRRRLKIPNNADRTASELLERGVRYMNDTAPYEERVNAMLSDYMLAGRGVLRVRYIPTLAKQREQLLEVPAMEPDGNARYFTANMNEVDPGDVLRDGELPEIEIESLVFERADLEHVPYCDFRHQPAKRWQDVGWVAFRHYFRRDEYEEAFGKHKADNQSFTVQSELSNQTSSERPPEMFKQAEVWEIWSKSDRKIYFISDAYLDGPIAMVDDGPEFYNLRDFFPTVEPLRSILTPSSLLPIPEFVIYQDLADELDEITAKIRDIVETIDVRGAYDGELPELGEIFSNPRRLTPIADWRALTDKGGLSGVLDFVDIQPQAAAFIALVQQRNALIETIYQTIGIPDIARGASDPRETATAQQIKGRSGIQRIAPRQRAVQRYLRDMMRLQCELMAEKFEPTTLEIMTGIKVTPEVLQLLRTDALRNFAVDIETDSTIASDQAQDAEAIANMVQGLAGLGQATAALPDAARIPLIMSFIRKFKLGRDVEIAVEAASEQPPAPDPEMVKAQQQGQLEAAKLQQKEGESMRKFQIDAQKLALEAEKLGLDKDVAEAEIIRSMGDLFNESNQQG